MPQFYDSGGNLIRLGSQLGCGGEGAVFAIPERAEVAAKIYHEPISAEKAEKLRQMVALKTDKLLKLAAWVTDVLTDAPENGKVVGFLMPRLSSGTAIHELYNPQSRRRRFPDADWRFLIRAAANTARAFAVVHAHDHAVGDVNHGNIVIARDATVRLIDCDSYHLNAPEQKFLCEVGVSTHTPPELQGKTLREIERTANHDAFGLAVLIFQMLFMGRHPFSGKFLGADGEQTLEQSIAARRFAYGDDAETRLMKPPPGTLRLAAVSPLIADLFRRAFLAIENRPSARAWTEALENLEENLSECGLNAAHYFYNGLEKCPWCALEGETGVLFFPARFSDNFGMDGTVDLLTVGRLIDAIKPPDVPPNLPAKVTVNLLQNNARAQRFSPQISAALAKFNQHLALYLVGLSLTIILMIVFLGFGSFIGIALGFFWICYVIVESLTRHARDEAQRALDDANQKWTVFQNDWKKLSSANPFAAKRTDLKKALAEYRDLPRLREEKLRTSENERRARQLDFYLKGFSISKANVRGLDDEKLRELRSIGICSAVDVSDQKFDQLPFFNQLHRKKLLEWRKALEKEFVFKTSPQLFKQEYEEVDTEIAVRREQLEAEIRGGLPLLQKLSLQVAHSFQNLSQQTEQIAAELQVAEKDFEKVADLKGTAVAWTVGVVFVSLIVGIPVRNMVNVQPDYSVNGRSRSYFTAKEPLTSGRGGGYNSGTIIVHDKKTPEGAVIALEELGEASEFYQEGVKQFSDGDYQKAAAAFEKAVKLKPDVSELHVRLGESLYLDGKYQKAVVAYNDGLRINPSNSDALHKLGSAYNKLLRRTEAIKAFKDAIEANPSLAVYSYYELGATLRADKKADEAIEYLETALSMQPNLNEARYELALSYAATGYHQLAWKEYEELNERDSEFTEKLYRQLTENNQTPPKYVLPERNR